MSTHVLDLLLQLNSRPSLGSLQEKQEEEERKTRQNSSVRQSANKKVEELGERILDRNQHLTKKFLLRFVGVPMNLDDTIEGPTESERAYGAQQTKRRSDAGRRRRREESSTLRLSILDKSSFATSFLSTQMPALFAEMPERGVFLPVRIRFSRKSKRKTDKKTTERRKLEWTH